MKILVLTPIMIFVIGLYFLFKLRFFFLLHPRKLACRIANSLKQKENFFAFSLALAGTLGVGNIVGVAHGLIVGGAGSVLWMLFSALFSCAIKYCESALSAYYDSPDTHGMMCAIAQSFRILGVPLSRAYAFLVLLLSLSMGTALQGGAAVSAAAHSLSVSPITVSFVFSLLLLIVIVGGVKKMEKFTAIAIPISSAIYVVMCIFIVLKFRERVPFVLVDIFRSALNFRSGVGGVSSFLIIKAVREGFARGLLSNEAGAGTSAMAEGRSSASPSDVGVLGMCEVFFDTVVLCTLTALAVLVSVPDYTYCSSGIELVFSAFSSLDSPLISPILFVLILMFALSTSVCWYYYGVTATEFLLNKKIGNRLLFFFVVLSAVGSLLPEAYVIGFTDVILLLLCVISLSTLIKSSERIVDLSECGGLIHPKISNKSDSRKKLRIG